MHYSARTSPRCYSPKLDKYLSDLIHWLPQGWTLRTAQDKKGRVIGLLYALCAGIHLKWGWARIMLLDK